MATFTIALQSERSSVALSLYMNKQTGQKVDLAGVYTITDKTLAPVSWRVYSPRNKLFATKLRFQIKLDDFRYEYIHHILLLSYLEVGLFFIREFASKASSNDTSVTLTEANDEDALVFYNDATSTLLISLEKMIGDSQSSNNWRLLMTYFNMIKIIEATGIGLVYGLRYGCPTKVNSPDLQSQK